MCTNIKELATCGSSYLNNNTKTLALTMAVSLSPIYSSCDSFSRGNDSLKHLSI